MSAEVLREAAALMRAHLATEVILRDGDPYYETSVMPDGSLVGEMSQFERHWSPAVALAVAKAMDDVAGAWEIADEVADGYIYDADDNHWTFEETVDGGWLNVARVYLGSAS